MISDHFPRKFTQPCSDGGVYYIRQLELDEATHGVSFHGMVWFGQELADQPGFANVYKGELRDGAGADECGSRLDRWVGKYYDVPKGRACSSDNLTVESYVVTPQAFSPVCDFPEHYLVQNGTSSFGGEVWGQTFGYGCWRICLEHGCCRREPPPIHPRILSLTQPGNFILDETIVGLNTNPLPAGFRRSASDNLTGTWIGDDGGAYYINHVPETDEVVWYAEHLTARPADGSTTPVTPASGWANVFFGQKVGNVIAGMFADVPRGAAEGAGRLVLNVESSSFISITAPLGNYGGRQLWRVESLDVTMVVSQLNVVNAQEGLDEPWLWFFFYKFDGDSVDLDNLTASHVGVPDPQPPSILVGDNVTGLLGLPTHHTTYRTTLSTVRSRGRPETEVKSATRIGVMAFAWEVDEGYSNEYRRSTFRSWKDGIRWDLNRLLQTGVLPSQGDILRADRIFATYLGPWEGWPWGDPDDSISDALAEVAFTDLEALASAAATLPGVPILRTLSFRNGSTEYSCRVEFFASPRSNPECR